MEEVKVSRHINRNIDPDNSFYDRESDENFEMEDDFVVEGSEEDEFSQDESEDF